MYYISECNPTAGIFYFFLFQTSQQLCPFDYPHWIILIITSDEPPDDCTAVKVWIIV